MSKVPPDIHEATVEKYRLRNRLNGSLEPDGAIDALAGAMRRSRQVAEQIVSLADAVMRDETLTLAARALKVRVSTMKMAEQATKSLDTARAKVEQELRHLEAHIAIPEPRDMMEAERHREIRSRFASLSEKERQDQLSAAMAAGQDRVVNAILGAETFVTGMGTAEHAGKLATWQAKKHPAETERLRRLMKAHSAFERGGTTFMRFVEQQLTSPAQELAEANSKRAEELMRAARTE